MYSLIYVINTNDISISNPRGDVNVVAAKRGLKIRQISGVCRLMFAGDGYTSGPPVCLAT